MIVCSLQLLSRDLYLYSCSDLKAALSALSYLSLSIQCQTDGALNSSSCYIILKVLLFNVFFPQNDEIEDIERIPGPGPRGSVGVWVWTHPGSSPEGTKFEFKLECKGNCSNINITENTHNGDVDLYAVEDEIPKISNLDQSCITSPRSRCVCESISSQDRCHVSQTKGTLFFTAFVYQTHTNLTVTVTGDNISNIYCVGECGGSNGTLST